MATVKSAVVLDGRVKVGSVVKSYDRRYMLAGRVQRIDRVSGRIIVAVRWANGAESSHYTWELRRP